MTIAHAQPQFLTPVDAHDYARAGAQRPGSAPSLSRTAAGAARAVVRMAHLRKVSHAKLERLARANREGEERDG